MDQQTSQNLQPPTGPGGRRLHIAHRRSPSELTPLMLEQLALQQQIESLQQQQQNIAATHQHFVNMGMIPPQQQMPGNNFGTSPSHISGASLSPNTFQFPQQGMQPQQVTGQGMQASMYAPTHRRNQSALPNMSMGPPPAPSSGASGSAFGDFSQQSRENVAPRGRGGHTSGHARRHSLALPEAKKAAELAEQKRKTAGFQFPIPGGNGAGANPQLSPSGDGSAPTSTGTPGRGTLRTMSHGRSQSMAVGNNRGGQARGAGGFSFPQAPPEESTQRRGSGHGRTPSRNFEGNWRQQNNNNNGVQDQQANMVGNFQMGQSPPTFQPGHRARPSMNQSISSGNAFQFPGQQMPMMQVPQGQMMMQQPQMFAGQGLNQLQLAQLQALQQAQASGQNIPGIQVGQQMGQLSAQQQQQQQQQQRKTLFTPYLPQATLPALLSDGQLVAGTLRVNKKNRSDAYVTTSDLDADIFICGSKDRNRALEGDLVAVELLDVDEVWGQKREKEEKKKRKDIADTRSSSTAANDATTGGDNNSTADGGVRRRGSLRQRPTQKKNDDVEVEGQSLLLMEEEEINDEQKPLYAGHVVAVIERVAGQMFSGTLGLLRPSSQATKEKQEAERQARDGGSGRQNERQQEKPKIVWFKPTDKRVPLIAIPTEQAPRDFVERHHEYANRIFVACIKRWPITSLHPFGTLVEQLGEMGDLKVETDALLRDNNFGPDDFSDAVLKSVGFEEWSVENDGEAAIEGRRDLRNENTFTIDPNGSQELDDALHIKKLNDDTYEVGVHVVDIAHFVKVNSLVDREAKKRGTGVFLMNRAVSMLPSRLASDICSLGPGQDRYTVSVIFQVDMKSGNVNEDTTWVGRSIVKSSDKISYDDANSVLNDGKSTGLSSTRVEEIKILNEIAQKLRLARFGHRTGEATPLRLLYQLDDENVPVEQNIFDTSPAHEMIEEINHRANATVARQIYEGMGEKAWLRRQSPPNPRRLQTFADRMSHLGYDMDVSSSGALQNSLFNEDDPILRKGMETLLVKTMQRAKYTVAGPMTPEELSHFALNLPLYTHFTNPLRRYADIIVHRQLEAVLTGNPASFAEDLESLSKTAELCNTKKDSAQIAQEQSVHIEACRKIDKRRNETGGDLICEGVVLCVYESAFDVLIPEYGFEKRVHCDQLPLKKAEFDKNKRILELYWEKGVASSAYIPEDERTKPGSLRGPNAAAARHAEEAARKQAEREKEEARRRQLDTGTISTDDADALFEDDEEEDDMSEVAESMAGVSLNPADHGLNGSIHAPKAMAAPAPGDTPEAKLSDKDKYMKFFKLREEGGNYIQDITEMTRLPVILKTDLTKSPPCLTIRSINPYAL